MNDARPTPPAAPPTAPVALARRLPLAVAGAFGGSTAVCAATVLLCGRRDWWPAFVAATVVSAVGAGVSIAVLSRAAGQTVDWLVTFVMGATVARMAVSLIGLLVATKLVGTPADPTGLMICGYYAAILAVETTLLSRATQTATTHAQVGGSHA